MATLRLTTLKGAALAGGILCVAALAASVGAEPPDFSGHWRLNRERSDDAQQKIEEAAGPASIKGAGGGGGRERWIPRNEGGEVDRVALREHMLALAGDLDDVEIAQTVAELRIDQGEASRTYYFGREHARRAASGETLKVRCSWKGEQLVVDQKGDNGVRLVEVFTLEPGGDQLVEALRYESRKLPKPLEVRLVYDRLKD
jgi:hypothetical protein